MNVTKTTPDKTTVVLKVELLPEEVKPYLDKAVKRISKHIKIPGFRPGNASYDIVKQHVSEMEIYQESMDDVLQDTLPKAVKQENVEFVGRPNINLETLAPGNSIVYTATLAIMPEVKLNKYKEVKVKKEVQPIDEKKFESTMDDLRKLRVKHEVVDRAAAKGDQVTIDFSIKLDNVPIEGGQGTAVPLTIGDNQFIPGFEDALVGTKAGESKKFKVTFPADYGAAHLAGKECDVDSTTKKVEAVILPTLDDEFAKGLQFKSLQELKDQIRGNLTKELDQKAEQEFETKVIEQVLEQSEFDPIPQPMIDYELDRMIDELREQVEDQGGKLSDYLQHLKKTEAELRDSWKDQAIKRIKGALVIKAVAEAEDIKVTEEKIDAEISRRKAYYQDNAEAQKQMDGFEYRGYVRTVLRNEQAVEKMKEYAAKA